MISEEAVAHVAASLRISTNRARRLAHTALPAGFVRSVSRTSEALLVEGPTDVAVFSALVDVPVLAVGGKNVLPLAVAVARAHGCEPRVVLDADAHHHRAHRGSERLLDLLSGTVVHVLPVDLEAALRDWPSFLAALHRTGSGLGAKDPAAYAAAVGEARRDDLPPALVLV
ncbi:hypothetical protein ACFQ46_08570 [Kineococcus sp. GCM10028916]|uniref:hypothetical protein n=1 Tax=Kineococcus sp. GCM10028916 TaxID=3273394 RepID=UPI003645C7B5